VRRRFSNASTPRCRALDASRASPASVANVASATLVSSARATPRIHTSSARRSSAARAARRLCPGVSPLPAAETLGLTSSDRSAVVHGAVRTVVLTAAATATCGLRPAGKWARQSPPPPSSSAHSALTPTPPPSEPLPYPSPRPQPSPLTPSSPPSRSPPTQSLWPFRHRSAPRRQHHLCRRRRAARQ
jgi:hypothetical protein